MAPAVHRRAVLPVAAAQALRSRQQVRAFVLFATTSSTAGGATNSSSTGSASSTGQTSTVSSTAAATGSSTGVASSTGTQTNGTSGSSSSGVASSSSTGASQSSTGESVCLCCEYIFDCRRCHQLFLHRLGLIHSPDFNCVIDGGRDGFEHGSSQLDGNADQWHQRFVVERSCQ